MGLVGLTIFILGFVRNYWRAIRFARSTQNAEGFWPLLYFTFYFLYNITESTIISQNGYFFWVMYVGTISWMLQQMYQAKSPQMDQTASQQPDELFREAPISLPRNMRAG